MNDSLLPSRPLRLFSAVASALWWLLVAFWLVLALAWGALQVWIVPNVGQLRPQLETQATRVLGIPVRIGEVSARSDGLVPTLELRNVVLLDEQAREALRLARVVVALSPRSLWNLGFEQLYVEGPQLEVRRSADGRLFVAGLDVSRKGDDERAADWFFRQKEVVVLGGRIRWSDETRNAPPLDLSEVEFVSRNGVRRHALRLDATPPAEWGSRFSLQGVFRQPILSTHSGRWREWVGQVYADFRAVDLALLRRYVDMGIDVQAGRGALRAWADVERGLITGGAADVLVRQADLRLGPELQPLALRSVSGRLSGKWMPPAAYEFETRGLQVLLADGRRWPAGNIALAWAGASGAAPAQGRLSADRIDLDAVARIAGHLPLDESLRAALARHAPQGTVDNLQARWQGPPQAPQTYQARGRVSGLAIAAADPVPGLRGVSGNFDFDQAGGRLRLQVRDGFLELPGILDDPRVPLDTLSSEVQWKRSGEAWSVDLRNLAFANPDVQANGQANWRTGDPGRGRLPGVLDLQLAIDRADGARVWRYLPTALYAEARDYVRAAVLAGRITQGQVRVRGDLNDFPFTDPRQGEFLFSARVRDVHYAYAPWAPTQGRWPALTGVSGELVFDRNAMRVVGAQGRVAGSAGLVFQTDASVADLNATQVMVDGTIRGPLPEAVAVFNTLPVAYEVGQPLARTVSTGPAEVRLRLQLPLDQLDSSRVQGSVVLAGNDIQLVADAPPLTRARGAVAFTEAGFTVQGVLARALGGELRIEGGSRSLPPESTEAPIVLRLQGTATADGLRQSRELDVLARVAAHASGAAAYAATLGVREQGVDIAVQSNLQGLALALPAPLGKPAQSSLPLRFEWAALPPAARARDQITLQVGRLAWAQYQRDLSGAQPQVLRGALALGTSLQSVDLPERGVRASVELPQLDLDAWQQVFARQAGPGAAAGGSADPAAVYLPTALSLRTQELTTQGQALRNVVVGGSRDGLTWRGNVQAEQIEGYLEYRAPPGPGHGRLVARLARLSIEASAASQVETLLGDQPPTDLPTVDVVVDDFELRGRRFGRLEIDAANRRQGGGRNEWHLNRLSLAVPEASFLATGRWTAASPAGRRTALNFRLDIADSGQLLARLGMGEVVRRGAGRLEGQVGWTGSPLALDYPSMGGALTVEIESGQFLKAEPGLAKLLGVLSLQSLPRRLALDFRDVFSEGFSFDFVRGDMTIDQGILTTNNLQMKGVNAAVLMDGRADLARETQSVRVIIVPEINAGTASLVAGVINPAIGLGTFLAQMFLREPLMRAATQEFQVDGSWTDPRVTRINRRTGAPEAPAQDVPGALLQGTN